MGANFTTAALLFVGEKPSSWREKTQSCRGSCEAKVKSHTQRGWCLVCLWQTLSKALSYPLCIPRDLTAVLTNSHPSGMSLPGAPKNAQPTCETIYKYQRWYNKEQPPSGERQEIVVKALDLLPTSKQIWACLTHSQGPPAKLNTSCPSNHLPCQSVT